MASVLIHKNYKKLFILCITILAVSILLSGCDPRSGQYPFQRAERWESKDPIISLYYIQQDDGTWLFSEKLQLNGETKEIDLAMQSSYYCVYPVDSNHHDNRLFSGSWKYRKGNLVLTVEEDFIFDGKYSEIALSPISKG